MSCSPFRGRKQLILKCQYLTLGPRNKIFFFFDRHIGGVCQPQVPCCSCCSVDMGPNSKQLWNDFALRLNMSGHVLTRASENAEEKWVQKHCQSSKCLQKKTTTHNTPKVFRHTYTRDGTSSTENLAKNWVSKRRLHPGPLLCNHFDPLLGTCCNSCNPRSAFFSSAPFRCIYRQPCERSQAKGRTVQV